jgi:hypothetical protein
LSALVERGSQDEAAGWAEHLSSASARVAKRCDTEELEVLQAFVDVLKGRLRRKWKQQRRNNAGAVATAFVLGTVVPLISRSPAPAPAWMTLSLVVIAAVVLILGLSAIFDATDWKDDVLKPLDAVTASLSKELADRSDRPVSYRESAGSTGVRVDRTIGAEVDPDDAGESSPKLEERGKTHG